MEIRALDVLDDAECKEFHGVTVRAETEDGRPWNRPWTYAEMVQSFREPDERERAVPVAAWRDGQLVGAAVLWLFLTDNVDTAWAEVSVDPPARRQGVGGALLEDLAERARAEGRSRLAAESSYRFEERETSPTLRFARAHGFRIANTEIHRTLPLPVAEELLEEIAAEAREHQGQYAVRSFVGALPDALVPSYCALSNLLAVEAPNGEFHWEPESLTPEIYAEDLRKFAEVGRTRWTTVATLDDEVVALTDIVLSEGEQRASQWFTIVSPEHRGHRLGQAVKVANLRAFTATHPEVTEVRTQNAETNANMVGINDRLGFVPVAVAPGFLRDL